VGTEALWRCEITHHSGILRADFRVKALEPGPGRVVELGRSRTHVRPGWGLDPSDAELHAIVDRLAQVLRAAGWEPVRPGRDPFSARFVWPRPDPPPLELPELATAEERDHDRS
jgi:hypothetical protein